MKASGGEQRGPIFTLDGVTPMLAQDVFVATTAAVIGDVSLGAGSSVWFSAILRGDDMPIRIGEGCNSQDGVIIHATETLSGVSIGRNVVIGHGAMLHGCCVEDGAMIGIGAIILDGATVCAGAVVAAGSLVPPEKTVPKGQLWIGNPGAVRRPVNADEAAFLAEAPTHYRQRARQYLANAIGAVAA